MNALQNTEFQESTSVILMKILSREYWLLRRQERSTVWQVYRQIVRSDGTKLRDYYFCTGCRRLMTSRDTSSLRSHICHVKYLQQRASDRGPDDVDPKGHDRVNVVFVLPWFGGAANLVAAIAVGFAMSVKFGSKNMFIINAPDEEEKCIEAQLDILLKINTGEYTLVKKNKRSSVWNVYREIARSDGSKLKWRYFCLGCKRVMQSSGGTTSNLRIHKCHVRYLKQNGGRRSPSGRSPSPREAPAAAAAASQLQASRSQQSLERRTPVAVAKKAPTFAEQYEQFYEVCANTETEDETEESHLEEEADDAEQIIESEHILEAPRPTSAPKPRPLLKLFSEDSWSCEPDLDPEEPEEQAPIELDHNDIQQAPVDDYKEEILQPKALENSNQFNASALSEAESYAKSWAHAFLRLSDEQKFYAKRSIDELLVLGRLEKLSLSTVTSLTTNL